MNHVVIGRIAGVGAILESAFSFKFDPTFHNNMGRIEFSLLVTTHVLERTARPRAVSYSCIPIGQHLRSRREGVARLLKTEYANGFFSLVQAQKFITSYAAFLKRQGKLPIPGKFLVLASPDVAVAIPFARRSY